MLFDTSKARITVPSRWGRPKLTSGRAKATSSSDKGGEEEAERHVPEAAAPSRADAVGTKPCAASVGRSARAAANAARRSRRRAAGDATTSTSISGQMNDISAAAAVRSSTMRTRAATRSSCGRHLVEVDAGPPGRRSQLGLALLGHLVEAPAELGVAGVDRQQLAGLGVLDHDHAGVGQLELALVDEVDGHQLVALAEQRQRPLPARLADEVRHEHHQRPARRMVLERRRGEVGQVGAWSPSGTAGCEQVVGDAQHLVAAADGAGWCARRRCSNTMAPTRLPPLVNSRASVVASSISTSSFGPVERTEAHRRRAVEQQPGRQLAVLEVGAHVRARPCAP